MIRVKSKREGFRRCGQAFTKKPTFFQDDRFSEKELAILAADPTLTVDQGEFDGAEVAAETVVVVGGIDEMVAALAAAKDRIEELGGLLETERGVRVELENKLASLTALPEESRVTQILAAAKMAVDNGDTIGSGKPDLKAMTAILGFEITADERDTAWGTLQGKKE